MADMYGAVRSNFFAVKDVEVFRVWFSANVRFGQETQVWVDSANNVSFGGYEQYPSAFPSCVSEDSDESEPWDLDEFANALRQHLAPGSVLVVVSAGHEKLRYVGAQRLTVSHTEAKFEDWYAGN